MTQSQSPSQKDGVVGRSQLCRHLAMFELVQGDASVAKLVATLLPLVVSTDPSTTPSEPTDSAVSAPLLLKGRVAFRQASAAFLSALDVDAIFCHALFECLTNGPAAAVETVYAAALAHAQSVAPRSLAHERLAMDLIWLMHCPAVHRLVLGGSGGHGSTSGVLLDTARRRAAVEEQLRAFPNNPALLGAFVLTEAQLVFLVVM
jgi:hypothetical protein